MAGRLAMQAGHTELTPCSLVRACRQITVLAASGCGAAIICFAGCLSCHLARRCQAGRSSLPVPAAPRPAAGCGQHAQRQQTQVLSSWPVLTPSSILSQLHQHGNH